MSNTEHNLQIDYIELPATDIELTKQFYTEVFGWRFEDYGESYTSFHDGRIAGGFWTEARVSVPGVLVVIYAIDLPDTEAHIKAAGGKIVKEPFDFPGGRRFHFADPNGNILAVWSEGNSQ